jgi:ankyrin repeat protein
MPLLILSNRFRWVYCQLEVLRKSLPKNLRRVLKELPKSLDETYQRILKEINNANQKEAHQLLQCLAVAQRPLRVEELADVLALDVDDGGIPRFNANWRWEDHEAVVLSACSSLVSVILDDDSRVVQFSHFSVKEFLTSDRLASMEDVSQFHIADEPSHAILAQACLGILLSVDDRTSEDSVEDIALRPYANENWFEHARVGKVELRIKDALDCLFDLDKPHLEALIRRAGTAAELRHFRARSDEDPKGVLTSAAPIFIAGSTGLGGQVERLMAANPQVIGLRLHGWTLLHLVVQEERTEVARLLLAHGVDINARPDSVTPPHIASLQSRVERPVDGNLEELEKIENSRRNSDTDVSSEDTIDPVMDFKKESDFTPLHIAVSRGYLDMCQMLLEHKADVRAQDNSGNTPLHLAASKGHLKIARILLKYNTEVNSRNEDGSTPLLMASSNGNIEISRLLLSHNADVFVHDDEGNTPLHLAAIGGHLEVARSLVELNADVSALNNEGLTPLQRALGSQSEGYLDIMRLLLDHCANVNVHDSHRSTPLHFAASEGHLELARMLLGRKVNVNAVDDEGSTPLHQASLYLWSGDPDIVQLVRLLLDDGADIHALDNRGNTPLHFAASRSHLEVARMLLELKADVNALNKEGSTPLHLVFDPRWKNPDIMRLFLDHGADANVHDKSGNTLLHFAAFEGDLKLTRVLLERIPEVVDSQNDDGSTAFLLALTSENLDIARLLLDHNPDVHVRDEYGYTPLHVAVSKGYLDICQILLERNAEVNSQTHHRSTPLLLASEVGTPDLVQLFLDHNADVHVCDADGDTPLHCATLGGKLEVAQLLLKLDIEVNSRNNDGSTPLHLASAGYRVGNPVILRLLLDHGADAQARNLNGQTASEIARGPNEQEIVQLLTQNVAE